MGIPAALVLDHQTDLQIRALLDQADQTTQTLLESKLNQMHNLAALLVQRPTLNTLLESAPESNNLKTYLEDLQSNSGFDAILICDGGTAIVSASADSTKGLCEINSDETIHLLEDVAWLATGADLPSGETIRIGQTLSSVFTEFTRQSGLQYALYAGGDLMVSNLSSDPAEFALSSRKSWTAMTD